MEDAECLVAPASSPNEGVVASSKEEDKWKSSDGHDSSTKSYTRPSLVNGAKDEISWEFITVIGQCGQAAYSVSPAICDGTAVRTSANA